MGVIESELVHASRASYTLAIAALYGNQSADVEKGGQHVNNLHASALSAIPYFHVAAEAMEDSDGKSREAAIEAWRRMEKEEGLEA